MSVTHRQKEDVVRAVEALLADGNFRASKRNKKFLEFVVGEMLEGRGERIKAYTIAVDVFGRAADFDPSLDPIVRIEAARLRTALRLYYEGPGAAASVQVVLPLGRYLPEFIQPSRQHTKAAFDDDLIEQTKVLIDVESPFESFSDALNTALELTIDNLRLRDLRVFYVSPEKKPSSGDIGNHLLQGSGTILMVSLSERTGFVRWRVSVLPSYEIIFCGRVKASQPAECIYPDLVSVAQQVARLIINLRAQ